MGIIEYQTMKRTWMKEQVMGWNNIALHAVDPGQTLV